MDSTKVLLLVKEVKELLESYRFFGKTVLMTIDRLTTIELQVKSNRDIAAYNIAKKIAEEAKPYRQYIPELFNKLEKLCIELEP